MGAPRFCAHRSFVHQGCHITRHRPRLFSSFVHVIKRNGSWVRLSLGMSNNCLWDSYRYQIWYDWVLLTFLSLFPIFTNLRWKLRNSICRHFIMYQKVRVFKGNRWGLDGGLVRRGCPHALFSYFPHIEWRHEMKNKNELRNTTVRESTMWQALSSKGTLFSHLLLKRFIFRNKQEETNLVSHESFN